MTDIDSAIIDAKRRATDYQGIDGLPVLAMAAYSLLMGSIRFWQHSTNSGWADLASMGVLVGWFLVLPNGPVMLWLKSRITYPRTGFVALPQPHSTSAPARSGRDRFLRGAAWVAIAACWVFDIYIPSPAMMGLIALTAGIAFLCFAYRDDARVRSLWLLIPSLWLSAWIETIFPTKQRGGYIWLIFGVLLFILGSVQLSRYLQQHRVPHG